ncbi:MAG: hypothetical protein MI920_20315, partial [Kiloniellales bacterium]|nr:hypothetical protein [Kiloniellales bacterium]
FNDTNNDTVTGEFDVLVSDAVVNLDLDDLIVGHADGAGSAVATLRWDQQEALLANNVTFGLGSNVTTTLDVPEGGTFRLGTAADPISGLFLAFNDTTTAGPLNVSLDFTQTNPTFEAFVANTVTLGQIANLGGGGQAAGDTNALLRLGSNSSLNLGPNADLTIAFNDTNNDTVTGEFDVLVSDAVVNLDLDDLIVGHADGAGSAVAALRWDQQEALLANNVTFGLGSNVTTTLDVPVGGTFRLGTAADPISGLFLAFNDTTTAGPLNVSLDFTQTNPVFEAFIANTVTLGEIANLGGGGQAAGDTQASLVLGGNSSFTVGPGADLTIGLNETNNGSVNGLLDASQGTMDLNLATLTIGRSLGLGTASGSFIMGAGSTVVANVINVGLGDNATGQFDFNDGRLSVTNFNESLDQDGGTLAPGTSAGTTTIAGDYDLALGATLEIELFDLQPGTGFDVVNVGGTAILDGTLEIRLEGGFDPNPGDSFLFLTAESISGTFADVIVVNAGDNVLELEFTDTTVTLVVSDAATENDDTIVGTPGDDVIDALGGDDSIEGLAGDDTLIGGPGDDSIDGGPGDDVFPFTVGDGADDLDGGADADTLEITGTAAADAIGISVVGAPGEEALSIATGAETLTAENIETINFTGAGGQDSLVVSGDLAAAGVANNTLRFAGGAEDDDLDATAVTSPTTIVAVFAGLLVNFDITQSGLTFTVTDLVGSEGTDTVVGATALAFTDETIDDLALVENNPIDFVLGGTTVLDDGDLRAIDLNSTPDQIRFTLTDLPDDGTLILGTAELGIGGSFTQQEILDGQVSYRHDGSGTGNDSFAVAASDGTTALPAATVNLVQQTSGVFASGDTNFPNANLIVGDDAFGSLAILGGASLDSSSAIIGNQANGVGVVALAGDGSSWNVSGPVIVGNAGDGTLAIGANTSVNIDSNAFDNLDVGRLSDMTGAVTVLGGNLTTTGTDNTIQVGRFGTGNFVAETALLDGGESVGAVVRALQFEVGREGTGTATFRGDGTELILSNDGGRFSGQFDPFAGFLRAGREADSNGRFVVEAEASVTMRPGEGVNTDTVGAGFEIARNPGSIGEFVIDDATMQALRTGAFGSVGTGGKGEMTVRNGGSLIIGREVEVDDNVGLNVGDGFGATDDRETAAPGEPKATIGKLSIEADSRVSVRGTNVDFIIGNEETGNNLTHGEVEVSGLNALLKVDSTDDGASGFVAIGNQGIGELRVLDQGTADFDVRFFDVGSQLGNRSKMIVNGTGSNLFVDGENASVGTQGSGAFILSGGATANFTVVNNVQIGLAGGADGFARIAGTNTTLDIDAGGFNIADGFVNTTPGEEFGIPDATTTGFLNLLDSATLDVDGFLNLGINANARGFMVVNNADVRVRGLQDGGDFVGSGQNINVGLDGYGRLDLRNDADVLVDAGEAVTGQFSPAFLVAFGLGSEGHVTIVDSAVRVADEGGLGNDGFIGIATEGVAEITLDNGRLVVETNGGSINIADTPVSQATIVMEGGQARLAAP